MLQRICDSPLCQNDHPKFPAPRWRSVQVRPPHGSMHLVCRPVPGTNMVTMGEGLLGGYERWAGRDLVSFDACTAGCLVDVLQALPEGASLVAFEGFEIEPGPLATALLAEIEQTVNAEASA